MASLLVGTAAVAGSGGMIAGTMVGVPAVAATSGLIGAGGAITAGGVLGALGVAGLGLGAYGMVAQGQAASAEARGAQAVADYNARVQEQEARSIEQATRYKQKRAAEEAGRYGSSLLAALGASGAVVSEGTPLMIQARQAAESELENLMIGYSGEIGANRALSQAAIDRIQGGIYGQRARSAATAGYIGAGSTLLSGFGKMYERKYQY